MTTALIVVIVGETCVIPNDDTLVGRADEKANERHSPQTGTNPSTWAGVHLSAGCVSHLHRP